MLNFSFKVMVSCIILRNNWQIGRICLARSLNCFVRRILKLTVYAWK